MKTEFDFEEMYEALNVYHLCIVDETVDIANHTLYIHYKDVVHPLHPFYSEFHLLTERLTDILT